MKPLSVAVAVSKKAWKIVGFQVSRMAARGRLTTISRKKYGQRPDYWLNGMRELFDHLSQQLSSIIRISSDKCPFYSGDVNMAFPRASYAQYLGKKGCVAGQGELKRPLLTQMLH